MEDLGYWAGTDTKLLARIVRLMVETVRTPFTGTGNPEPLKADLSGSWSRRITDEHRLVYRVEWDRIVFRQARFHYHR